MSLNVTGSSINTSDYNTDTGANQATVNNSQENTGSANQTTNSDNNTVQQDHSQDKQTTLANQLKEATSNQSELKNRLIVVDLPKDSDGKPVPADQLNIDNYQDAFLKSAFRAVGLNNVTSKEIKSFQQNFNTVTNRHIGLDSSPAELRTEQAKNGGDKIGVNVSDYDLAVLTVGKNQILSQRVAQSDLVEKVTSDATAATDQIFAGFYKLQINGVINTINDATKVLGSSAIPTLDVKGEYWQDKKDAVEFTTTFTAGLLLGKTGAFGAVANVLTTAAQGTELITGKDYRTGRVLTPEERAGKFLGVTSGIYSMGKPVSQITGKLVDEIKVFRTGRSLPPVENVAPSIPNVESTAISLSGDSPAFIAKGAELGINKLAKHDKANEDKAKADSDNADKPAAKPHDAALDNHIKAGMRRVIR